MSTKSSTTLWTFLVMSMCKVRREFTTTIITTKRKFWTKDNLGRTKERFGPPYVISRIDKVSVEKKTL